VFNFFIPIAIFFIYRLSAALPPIFATPLGLIAILPLTTSRLALDVQFSALCSLVKKSHDCPLGLLCLVPSICCTSWRSYVI